VTRLLVDGVHYEVKVGGGGPALLLLHGFTGRGSSWAPHLPALRRVATTMQVDLLGHGESDAPTDPARHSVERQAADLAEIARRVAGSRVTVLGYSLGARVSLALAIGDPAAVRRLVLESPSAGIADPRERAGRRASDEVLAGEIERDGVPAFVERWENQPLFATQASLSEAARRRLHDERLRNSAAGLASSLRGAGQGAMTPLCDRLSSVATPTLVICGALDPVRPRTELVAAGISGARLEVAVGAGHAVHLEAPAVFRSLVLSFVSAPQASLASSEEVA
jgi:2-succinyl-6-hydroxy-2,4-cyclohexadiene-1-carboxylate synthase